MNLSLPAPLRSWVDQQVALRGYDSAAEFVRDVLRREQIAAAKARVDQRLLESIESGPARRMDRKAWDRVRSEGAALARQRKTK